MWRMDEGGGITASEMQHEQTDWEQNKGHDKKGSTSLLHVGSGLAGLTNAMSAVSSLSGLSFGFRGSSTRDGSFVGLFSLTSSPLSPLSSTFSSNFSLSPGGIGGSTRLSANFGCVGLERCLHNIGIPRPNECTPSFPDGYVFIRDSRAGANGNGGCGGDCSDGMYNGTCDDGTEAVVEDGNGYSNGDACEDV